VSGVGEGREHTIRPPQQRTNQLQRLKLLRITPINSQEMQEVIRDNLAVDVIFWPSFLQYPKCFGEMLVQCDCFVS
jgi:hypothetical protein